VRTDARSRSGLGCRPGIPTTSAPSSAEQRRMESPGDSRCSPRQRARRMRCFAREAGVRIRRGSLPLRTSCSRLGVRSTDDCLAGQSNRDCWSASGACSSGHENASRKVSSGSRLTVRRPGQGLSGRTQSGRPFWTMGFEPEHNRWPPLRLARVCFEHVSVCVVLPAVLPFGQ
jgi:hypothetical protein